MYRVCEIVCMQMVMCTLSCMSVCIVYIYVHTTDGVDVFGDTWHMACVYMSVDVYVSVYTSCAYTVHA